MSTGKVPSVLQAPVFFVLASGSTEETAQPWRISPRSGTLEMGLPPGRWEMNIWQRFWARTEVLKAARARRRDVVCIAVIGVTNVLVGRLVLNEKESDCND